MGFDSARRESTLSSGVAVNVLDDFFAQYYRTHPVNATFTGIHDYDEVLPDWSASARARENVELHELLTRVLEAQSRCSSEQNDGADYISPRQNAEQRANIDYHSLAQNAEQLDLLLAEANLTLRLAEVSSGHFRERNAALWTGEAIFGVVSLMIRNSAPVASRLHSITARLAVIPKFLNALPEALAAPIPERWRDRAVRECVTAVELFDSGLNAWIDEQRAIDSNFPEADSVEIAAVRAAAMQACAAFEKARVHLDQCALADESAYSAGEALLETMIWNGHFCPEPARSLLSMAQHAMQHEQQVLSQMLKSRAIDWNGAQAVLAADCTTVTSYYEAFAQRWTQIHDSVVAKDVVTWPDWPIRYVPIPTWARTAQPNLYWLFYRSPAPFDQYNVYDYVVTPVEPMMSAEEQTRRLSAWNNSVITLNHVVHHGGLGHHVQNWNATHQTRSRIGKIAAVDCASRIGMFLGGSMAEGWACYATDLAEELELLTDNEQLSQQHTRVRQIARAIVDIKLHCGDWAFAESAQYYVTQTGMSAELANAETTKNAMFPGTALMYWLGTKRIADLRNEMKLYQRTEFNMKHFHDELLSFGSIPVYLMANMMLAAHNFPL